METRNRETDKILTNLHSLAIYRSEYTDIHCVSFKIFQFFCFSRTPGIFTHGYSILLGLFNYINALKLQIKMFYTEFIICK